jgi:chemotaxis protein MotA
LMDLDLDVHHHEASIPVASLSTVADSLPGLGIVAAVLGVVITMGALGGPPEEIGHKVAAALVGTFLGILLCYGFLGPMASNMSKAADEERAYLGVLKVVVISFLKGTRRISLIVQYLDNTDKETGETVGKMNHLSGSADTPPDQQLKEAKP